MANPVTRSLRIALVYDAVYPFSIGGIERRNYELARALQLRGHQVIRIGWCEEDQASASSGRLAAVGPVRPLHDSGGRRHPFDALRFAWDVARLAMPDVDVVESANLPYLHLWPLASRCRARGVPLLVTWHEYWGAYWATYRRDYLGAWFGQAVERLATTRGTSLCAVSELTRTRLASAAGRPVELLVNGIREELLSEARIEPESSRVVAVGRLIPEKRIDVLIEAVAQLGSRQVELEIVGDGPDHARLLEVARRAGVADRVRFTGRLGSEEEVQRRIASASLLCHPSAREGFGLVPLEAMALGVAVILGRSSENAAAELVRPGVDGLHAEPTPEGFAAAIDELLGAPSRRAEMGASGRERARSFTWTRVAERFEALALEAVAGCLGGQRERRAIR